MSGKKLKVAVSAIMKNEVDYVLEWLAWHRVQGFDHFIVYDNKSEDGTFELLVQLEKLGFLTVHSIEDQVGAQQKAYLQVIHDSLGVFDVVGFIDADEFLMPQGGFKSIDVIRDRFECADVGGCGINWRVYGSGGQVKQAEGFVMSRFNHAASDVRLRNHYLKSFYRPEAINKIFPHRGALKPGYTYVNARGNKLEFASCKDRIEPVRKGATTGVSLEICNSGLRVNHYALKSEEEFLLKKKHKGNAMRGSGHVRSEGYFKEFDLNDEELPVPSIWLERLSIEHKRIARMVFPSSSC